MGENAMQYELDELKNKSRFFYRELEKDLIDINDTQIDNYEIGLIINHIIEKDLYEVYYFISGHKKTVSGIYNRLFRSKIMAKIYFDLAGWRLEQRGLKLFFKK